MIKRGYRKEQMDIEPDKNSHEDEIELIDSNIIKDKEVRGRKPTSPPSSCKNMQPYTILPHTPKFDARPDAAPGTVALQATPSDLMVAEIMIRQFSESQVEPSGPHEGVDATSTSSHDSTISGLTSTNSHLSPLASNATRNTSTTFVSVSSNGNEFVLEVPTSHKIVNKAHLSKIKTKADQLDALTKQLSFARYRGTDEGNRLLGAAMALLPQTSDDAMALTIPLAYAALFANAGIAVNPELFAKSSPCCGVLKTSVADAAADSMFVYLESIRQEGSRVFNTCDKGGAWKLCKNLVLVQ
jgi:hypothetical protein